MSDRREQAGQTRGGQLRSAMNSYRRRVEDDLLDTRTRLRAAEELATAVEAAADVQPPAVLAALRAYRGAGR